MHHVAIFKKSWKLIDKILNGTKVIESRWSVNKIAPWDSVRKGDLIFLKNSGDKVRAVVEVDLVVQFSNLNKNNVKEILIDNYQKIGIEPDKFSFFLKNFENKKNCILIYLKNAKKIEPFKIKKDGFGNMASWMIVKDVNSVKI
ncbi:hypothetical protein COV13_00005 [Candidatus Woesearchaeota archaeon CG10_big_fil_rev_8_21_14_0_10_32_9]|nr:MAG: hypothetical protein COV13_00005 [Candidatus Woesearchaeota archaeon CG10_big_fil_rev_8_21_14_0_10_32_9]